MRRSMLLLAALCLLTPGVLDAQIIVTPSGTTTTWTFNADGTSQWEVTNTVNSIVFNGQQTFHSTTIGSEGLSWEFGTKPVPVIILADGPAVPPLMPVQVVPVWNTKLLVDTSFCNMQQMEITPLMPRK